MGTGSAGTGGTGGTAAGGSTGAGGSSAGQGGGVAGRGGAAGGGAAGTTAGRGGSGGGVTGTAGTGGGMSGAVTVQLGQTKQTIDGFGINDTWSALTDAQAKAMFDVSTGIGLTILRVGMNPSGGFYNSNEASSISAAKKYGATHIIGSVWSPPANCKDNNSITMGGHVKESCYGSWSDSITTFAKNNSLYAMSAGNEPDFASCGRTIGPPCNGDYDTTLYTANEMVAFVKVLGPKLKAAGIKLIAPEASEWLHFWSNVSATGSTVASHPDSSDPLKCGCFVGKTTACSSTCTAGGGYDYGHWLYKDTTAWGLIDIIGVHQYDTQIAEPWPADVNGGKPDKPIWQTEMSGVKYWPEEGPSTTIENGVAVAGWVHNALTVGEANAWLWWWYNGTSTNEGLYNNGADTKRHYTYGNFTKFVRPGYVRVDVTGNANADLLLSAYKGSDGTVVVVAINKGTSSVTVPISLAGGTAPASLTPWVTSSSDNLASKTAIAVSGGSFAATLAGKTVTTYVGKP
jgi:glucuronoarabinoxylan endo-1,4-beta-xylanase